MVDARQVLVCEFLSRFKLSLVWWFANWKLIEDWCGSHRNLRGRRREIKGTHHISYFIFFNISDVLNGVFAGLHSSIRISVGGYHVWFSSTRQGFESPIWNIVCFFLLVECVGLCDELFFWLR